MTKMLVELLQAKEPLFSTSLRQLEAVSGKPSVDVRLSAEIMERFNSKVKELGLDPKDSTGEEIYAALINLAKQHDEHLAKQIGATDPEDIEAMLPLVKTAVDKVDMKRDCWVLKDETAKDMLRGMPPQKVMEVLGYSDVNQMLDKENLYEVYGALRFAEDEDWLNEFNTQYKALTADDFETRDIQMVFMPKEKWGDIAAPYVEKKNHLNTHLKELGVVIILPSNDDKMKGAATKLLTLTFHYYSEIRLYSAFFKLQKDQPNFGETFVNTLNADISSAAIMAGQNVHWRVIQRYYAKVDEYHPEIFEPHVQPEDLHWRRAEELIFELDPTMEFWKDLDYVAKMYDGRALTMNLMDVSLSYSNGIGYDTRYIYHFKESLWNEVFMRYMGQKVLENQVLKQLDNDMIAPENI